jgi:hypothetical protein
MAAQEKAAGNNTLQQDRCPAKPSLVLFSGATRRSVHALLPKSEIAAQHGESSRAEGVCQRNQQRRVAVGPGAVGQHQPLPARVPRGVEKATNRLLSGRVVNKRL